MNHFVAPRLGLVPLRPRYTLGAEELIELGRASTVPRKLGAPNTGLPSPQTVTISSGEGKLMLQVAQNIVQFSQDYQIEYQSYCPSETWQAALEDVGTWTHEIERQLATGTTQIVLPADTVFRLVDLEKCVSAARDARLDTAKAAFTISAIGAVADFVFGIKWLGTVAYVSGLALLLGRPLLARFYPSPQSPYAPTMKGRCARRGLGATCELIRMKMEEDEKQNPDARKVLERTLISDLPLETHYWGDVYTPEDGSGEDSSICLQKGRFRISAEGKSGMKVVPKNGWQIAPDGECWGSINIAVYDKTIDAARLAEAELNQDSGHGKSYWVEYYGPLTQGRIRRAGPFGCTGDPVDHAMEDAGFTEAGVDGGYTIFDSDGTVVDRGT
jgi:hypothetical protein